MHGQDILNYSLFELPSNVTSENTRVSDMTRDIVQLCDLSMRFARSMRAPRYPDGQRESNVEHTFMGALVVFHIVSTYYPDIDPFEAAVDYLGHDLLELEKGDVWTYNLSDEAYSQKNVEELSGLPALLDTLPPSIGNRLVHYEAQDEPGPIISRILDKILPRAIDYLGQGARVMREDYHHTTAAAIEASETRRSEQLRRLFPDPRFAELHDVGEAIASRFVAKVALAETVGDGFEAA